MNVALLPPRIAGEGDFVPFGLGAIDWLSVRLRRHTTAPNFQLASFPDGIEQKISRRPRPARSSASIWPLMPTLEQAADVYRARLDLVDASSGRVIGFAHRAGAGGETVPVPGPHLPGGGRAAAAALARPLRVPRPRRPRRRNAALSPAGDRAPARERFARTGAPRGLRLRERVPDGAHRRGDARRSGRCAGRALPDETGDTTWLKQAEVSAREAVGRDAARAEPHRASPSSWPPRSDHARALPEYVRASEIDSHRRRGEPARGAHLVPPRTAGARAAGVSRDHRAATALLAALLVAGQLVFPQRRRGPVGEELPRDGAVRTGPCGGVFETGRRAGAARRLRLGDRHPEALARTAAQQGRLRQPGNGLLPTPVASRRRSTPTTSRSSSAPADYVSWLNLGDAYSWLQGPARRRGRRLCARPSGSGATRSRRTRRRVVRSTPSFRRDWRRCSRASGSPTARGITSNGR